MYMIYIVYCKKKAAAAGRVLLLLSAVLPPSLKHARPPSAKEERLQQAVLTVAEMKGKIESWGLDMQLFNKKKNKEDKQEYLLQAWFKKFLYPTLANPAPTSVPASKSSVGDSKKAQIQEALDFKADILAFAVEAPELHSKILLLQQEWLDKILDGTKTMELRKSLIDETEDTMYLAVKDCILGKCRISHPIHICNLEEFEALIPAHRCPAPFYSFPMVGHRVSQCQKLQPVKFKKLKSCIGRALFRPVGTDEPDDSEHYESARMLLRSLRRMEMEMEPWRVGVTKLKVARARLVPRARRLVPRLAPKARLVARSRRPLRQRPKRSKRQRKPSTKARQHVARTRKTSGYLRGMCCKGMLSRSSTTRTNLGNLLVAGVL